MLRSSVLFTREAQGCNLFDQTTGFSVDLTEDQCRRFTTEDPDHSEIWKKLRGFGLTAEFVDPSLIRATQRRLFSEANLPLDRLKLLLGRIRLEVPYFRDRAGLYDPASLTCIEDVAALPYMRKRDLRENFPTGVIPVHLDVAAGLEDGSLSIVPTSGTGGDRLQVISRTMINRLPFGCDDLFGVSIGGEQPRTAVFTTPVCASGHCSSFSGSYKDRLSKHSPDLSMRTTDDPFLINRLLLEGFINDLQEFSPKILLANPIYLHCLIRRAEEFDLRFPKVELVQTAFEFAPAASVRTIRSAFNVPVLNDYGASEENRIALECHNGKLHVRNDVVYVEIVDSNGPCDKGRAGAICITTFDTITPLVRYLIGDVGSWSLDGCNCEFAEWPCLDLHGRMADMIYSRRAWVSALDLDVIFSKFLFVEFYKVIQHDETTIEVMIIPRRDVATDYDGLRKELGRIIDSTITFRVVTRIDPQASMKIGTIENRSSCRLSF